MFTVHARSLYSSLRQSFGAAHFNFIPSHYMLPEQRKEFEAAVKGTDITKPGSRWIFKSRKHKVVNFIISTRRTILLFLFP